MCLFRFVVPTRRPEGCFGGMFFRFVILTRRPEGHVMWGCVDGLFFLAWACDSRRSRKAPDHGGRRLVNLGWVDVLAGLQLASAVVVSPAGLSEGEDL